MHYNFRTYLYGTVAALAMVFLTNGTVLAQGVISLADDIKNEGNAVSQSDNSADLALFDDVSAGDSTGVDMGINAAPSHSPSSPEAFTNDFAETKQLDPGLRPVNPNAQEVNDPIPLSESNGSGFHAPMIAPPAEPVAPRNNDPLLGGGDVRTTTTTTVVSQPAPKQGTDDLADKLIAKTNDTLFSQMSDLERQTTLLTLELRREKIKSEIEAIKAQRRRAEEEEKAFLEEKERKKKEWENEQARLLLIEEQKIAELEIAMEKERQEKIVKAYKDYMLEENQKWVKNNEEIYKNLEQVEKERDEVFDNLKTKINALFNAASAQVNAVKEAKARYDKKIEEYQLQISILKARLEAAEAEKRAMKANPFAEGDNFMENPNKNGPKLSSEYAILDVRGQGDELVAKLMNADKKTFNVKVGTILHTGHKIDEITKNYVRGDLDGFKDFIYLSVGNAIEKEPVTTVEDKIRAGSIAKRDVSASQGDGAATTRSARKGRTLNTNRGIPSVSSGLMVK